MKTVVLFLSDLRGAAIVGALVGALLALLWTPAHADVVRHVTVATGYLVLHDTRGHCADGRLVMESREARTYALRYRGCWSAGSGPSGNWVLLEWDDGDRALVPAEVFRPGPPGPTGPQT